jgi:hypothetical protein
MLQRLGRGPLSVELETLTASAKQTLGAMRGALAELDPGLAKTADKAEATIEHALAKLQAKAERAAGARPPERVARLRRVRQALRPGGQPQERVYGLPAMAHLGAARIVAGAVQRAPADPGAAVSEVELPL